MSSNESKDRNNRPRSTDDENVVERPRSKGVLRLAPGVEPDAVISNESATKTTTNDTTLLLASSQEPPSPLDLENESKVVEKLALDIAPADGASSATRASAGSEGDDWIQLKTRGRRGTTGQEPLDQEEEEDWMRLKTGRRARVGSTTQERTNQNPSGSSTSSTSNQTWIAQKQGMGGRRRRTVKENGTTLLEDNDPTENNATNNWVGRKTGTANRRRRKSDQGQEQDVEAPSSPGPYRERRRQAQDDSSLLPQDSDDEDESLLQPGAVDSRGVNYASHINSREEESLQLTSSNENSRDIETDDVVPVAAQVVDDLEAENMQVLQENRELTQQLEELRTGQVTAEILQDKEEGIKVLGIHIGPRRGLMALAVLVLAVVGIAVGVALSVRNNSGGGTTGGLPGDGGGDELEQGPTPAPFRVQQLGSDLDGSPETLFGFSVAASKDGNRIVVGAVADGENGENAGQVRTYELADSQWNPVGSAINGVLAGEAFGYSVAMSLDGTRLVVGASGANGNGVGSGAVRNYVWSGTDWNRFGADLNGEEAADQAGYSLAMSANGTRVAFGAVGNGLNTGQVRVHEWDERVQEWNLLGEAINGEAQLDLFGASLAMSSDGNRIAVGAIRNDGAGNDAGHVRVFDWTQNEWVQAGLNIEGEAPADQFGYSIAMSDDGNRIAVGATKHDGIAGPNSGHVRVFNWDDETTTWNQTGSSLEGEAADDDFGFSVAMTPDGARIFVGSTLNDGNGNDAGHVRIYEWDGLDWTQVGADLNGEALGNWFGYSLATAINGARLIVGAPLSSNDDGQITGSVRFFALPAQDIKGEGES